VEFEEVMEYAARFFEVLGVAIIVIGGFHALARAVVERRGKTAYLDHARRNFGRPLILGLEVLIAADVIQTITVDPSYESAAVLGILVLVRIILTLALDVEIDGMWPWKRAEWEAAQAAQAARPK
jgi:uncharacterized membrane protein